MRTLEEAIIVVYRRPGPEFLVLLRSPQDHGYWHLVAGGIEEGEQPAAAARRELSEETALDAARSLRGARRSTSATADRVATSGSSSMPTWPRFRRRGSRG